MKIPGMPAMPEGMANPMAPRPSTQYIKGTRMRTDMSYDQQKRFGGKQKITQTTIQQCDKQKRITFNNKNKKYYSEPMSGQASTSAQSSSSAKPVRKNGVVTITGGVTDTGERAKLFGYNAKHLKQSITMTPGKDACQKETLKIEIDGWYIDLPEYSCPVRRKPTEFQMGTGCYDDVDFQMKGEISGVPVKEFKTLTMQGMTMNIEEEALEIIKRPLSDDLFEPPANYKAANFLKEVEEEEDDTSTDTGPQTRPEPATTNNTTTLALPRGGVENVSAIRKKPGTIRIGIAKPEVQLADKDSTDAASTIGDAVVGLFEESLKGQDIGAVELSSDSTDADAKRLECDYIIYANITQKHGGGGLFGKIVTAHVAAIKGVGPNTNGTNQSAATVAMMQAMSGVTKGRDEFTLEYKFTKPDKTVVSTAKAKSKANFDTEDVLTPNIKEASKAVLASAKKP